MSYKKKTRHLDVLYFLQCPWSVFGCVRLYLDCTVWWQEHYRYLVDVCGMRKHPFECVSCQPHLTPIKEK